MQTARLFINGNSQAVRLPKDFRFEGDEVVIKKVGNAVVLLPKRYAYADLKALLEEDWPTGARAEPTSSRPRAGF